MKRERGGGERESWKIGRKSLEVEEIRAKEKETNDSKNYHGENNESVHHRCQASSFSSQVRSRLRCHAGDTLDWKFCLPSTLSWSADASKLKDAARGFYMELSYQLKIPMQQGAGFEMRPIHLPSPPRYLFIRLPGKFLFVCVCVCDSVCVCVCARARARERERVCVCVWGGGGVTK